MPAPSPQLISTGDDAFADRRRSPRRPMSFRGWVNQGANLLAEVELADMSFHGVAFNSPRPLEPGAAVEIVLNRPDTFDLRANLRVVSCRRGPDGAYRVGAEIV